jgi:hypothetical protein
MSDKKDDDTKKEVAALKAEVEALKSALSGKEDKPPKSTFVPMTDAEWRDQMHQLAEKRMSLAMPPSVHQYFADGVTAADCADLRQQAHRPTGRPGMIPTNPQTSVGSGEPVNKSGWRDATPIGPPPGIDLIDRAVNAALPHGPEWGKKPKG